jgi:uncharacterized protein (DUF433 family)
LAAWGLGSDRFLELPPLLGDRRPKAKLLTLPVERAVEPAPVPRVHRLSQRLSEETVAALVSDYRSGASLDDLQRSYLLSRSSVQKLLSERGVKRRRRSLTQDELAVLVERYEAGQTIREIAAEQDLPKTTVQDALARAGIKSDQLPAGASPNS